MVCSEKMVFRITFPLLVLLMLCGACSGDPTILLNAPMGGPGLGGVYGAGMHPQFLFDRDDFDFMLGAPGFGPPVLPAAAPMSQPPTILVLDGSRGGGTIINNDISSQPIPGVRYVYPRRRSSRRSSSSSSSPYYRRSRNLRRRFGYYG